MSDTLGAQAYLESLRAENTMMEHEIKSMENATKKAFVERRRRSQSEQQEGSRCCHGTHL
jgi:cell division protein FtsB